MLLLLCRACDFASVHFQKKEDLRRSFVQTFQRKVLNSTPPFSGHVPNSSRLGKIAVSYIAAKKVAEVSVYVRAPLSVYERFHVRV